MNEILVASPARWLAALVLICSITAAKGQGLAAAQSPATAVDQAALQAKPAASENDAMLAKAGKLYYSTTKLGLSGFTCSLRPDWHEVFASAQPGAMVAADDPRVVLLNTVKITLHARMRGNSTMDWEPAVEPGKPLDPESVTLLDNMHKGTEQSIQGFLQFWTPFVDGSAIPESSAGIEITPVGKGYSLNARQGTSEVTEILDGDLVLVHFDVAMDGATVKFAPTFQPTEKGLLVTGFNAQIRSADAPPEKTQEIRVGIEYKPVQEIPIPSRLTMESVGTGIFNFRFEDCTVTTQAK